MVLSEPPSWTVSEKSAMDVRMAFSSLQLATLHFPKVKLKRCFSLKLGGGDLANTGKPENVEKSFPESDSKPSGSSGLDFLS